MNITNVQIKKRNEGKTLFVKLPFFKVDLHDKNKNILSLTSFSRYNISVKLPKKTNVIAQRRQCQKIGHT